MKVGILNPAPIGPALERWGDFHFGNSLKGALEAIGVEVEQKFWPQWGELGQVNACLTLRGKRSFRPAGGRLDLIWVMSHPASVSGEELNSYDHAFLASETHKKMLDGTLEVPVSVLRQCTDAKLFHFQRPLAEELRRRRSIVFVANSRGVRRPILSTFAAAGIKITLIGRHWDELGLGDLVTSQYVANSVLPELYATARLVLNDHWADMKHFGIINNRVFDCLATGSHVISDSFPELKQICGSAVSYLDGPDSLATVLEECLLDYEGALRRAREFWERSGTEYTFDRRAQQIADTIKHLQARQGVVRRREPPALEPDARLAPLQAALADAAGNGPRKPVQVLHLFPDDVTRRYLTEREDIDYITAGVGDGPWLVDITNGVGLFKEGRFQLILLGGNDHAMTADMLQPLLAPNGQLLLV